MAIHWRCRFKSLNGTDYSINIYDATYSGSTPVELTGAANPFETQEDAGDDVLKPVRTSTGTISLVNINGLNDLIPATPKARYVTLTSGNDTLWQGYIQQAQFTQQWQSVPYVVELPVVSALGILSGPQIEKGEIPSRARIAEYFRQAILKSGGTYTQIVFPAEIGVTANGTWDAFWRFGIQERNWFTYKNENVLDADESRFDGVTWLEMMESMLEAFGYTMYERGTVIYILSRTATNYLGITMSDLSKLADNDEITPTTITPSTIQISSLQIGDSNGTIDIVPVKRRAIVEGSIKQYEEDSTPQIDTKYLDYVATVTVDKQQTGSAGTYYFNEQLGVYQQKQGASIWQFRSFLDGVQQTWDGQDITRDYHIGAFCRRLTGEDILFINYNNVGQGTGWGGDWTISAKSASQSLFAGGFFLLQGSVELHQGTGAATERTYNGKFMLRVGDYYYNVTNDTWQTTPCTFLAAIDENSGKLIPYNTYNMQNGDDKIYIKVPNTGIFGDVELRFYDPESSAATQQELEAVFVFRDITLDYIWPIQSVFNDNQVTDTNRFVESMNSFAASDEEKNIQVTSFIGNRMGYGVLIKPDFSAPLEKAITRDGNSYFEETLIDAMTSCLRTPQQILRIPIRRDAPFSPLDTYVYNGSHKYLSCRTTWRDSLQYLQIFKNL